MGPHTTCHGLVHREKERVAERQQAPPLQTVSPTSKRNISSSSVDNAPEQREIPGALRQKGGLPALLGYTFGEDVLEGQPGRC